MKEAIVRIEGNCMSNKIDSIVFQLILLQHFLARAINLDAIVGFRISFFKILNSLEEFLASPLLKQPHEIRSEGFFGSDWHFEDLHATLAEETALFELKHVGTVDG